MKKYLRVENEMIEVELREEGSLIPLFFVLRCRRNVPIF